MFEIIERTLKKYKVLIEKDMSVYPDHLKWGDDVGLACYGGGRGYHWWDYSQHDINLLIKEVTENWDKWFKGFRKVSRDLLPYQIWELALDVRSSFDKKWFTKKEIEELKRKRAKIASMASKVSYYSQHKH